ncbi:NAD-dependent malic enzyme [candidate division KSB1 bacterium]|nr:MAG: NAD-dependent malic enzyme [candidate division KSB1 bacterium]
MNRFEMRVDPLTQEVYYEVPLRGYALMQDPLLNKGHAFPASERRDFDLTGLMTETEGDLDDQVTRSYGIFKMKATDLERYVTLIGLLDRNETNFYALVARHLEEMLPIVYTPTVGEACLKLSHITRRYRGIYVTAANVNSIESILENIGLPNISLMVVTDGERILGYGDLGADGMGIPVGKIALYAAAAGIHPASTLPVCIDVGTDNERLLNDPLYLGIRQRRLRGEAYYQVVERFIQGVCRVFPRALVQWEDIGKQHAFTLLDRYAQRVLSFNDDIQGTGATAAAALRTAVRMKNRPLSEERIAILGFGQAGSGVANAIATMMNADEGISLAEARRRIFAIDMPGLLLEGMNVEPYQQNFLQPLDVIANWPVSKFNAPSLAEVVKHAKITTLIGLSAQPGIFDEPILRDLAANTDRPIVFSLSNPTSQSETTPEVCMKATKGRALMAAGSPFAPVTLPDGKTYHVAQCNNLYVFPGMGLGAIVCQASRITHRMFHAASCAISDMVTDAEREKGRLLPPLTDIRNVSFNVALAVAKQAREDGQGMVVSDERLAELLRAAMWEPHYYPYRPKRTA